MANASCSRPRDVTKRFSGITAVDDVSIQLHEGEILGVIGPNGAGKTTLFDLISGFLIPDAGRILLDGHDITTHAAAAACHARARPLVPGRPAVRRAHRARRDLRRARPSAADLGPDPRDALDPRRHQPSASSSKRADELIEIMGLDDYRDKFVSDLSTGSRRIVDLACQIGIDPKVILFDEPSSGIAQRETEALGPLLLRIRDITGASILVIEHDMPLITTVSDRIVACDLGQRRGRRRRRDGAQPPAGRGVVPRHRPARSIERSDSVPRVLDACRGSRGMTATDMPPVRAGARERRHTARARRRSTGWFLRMLDRYRNSFSVAAIVAVLGLPPASEAHAEVAVLRS